MPPVDEIVYPVIEVLAVTVSATALKLKAGAASRAVVSVGAGGT